MNKNNGSGPSTFRRGLEVLESLRLAGEQGLTIPEIVSATNMQRSTTYRFLDVLVITDCP